MHDNILGNLVFITNIKNTIESVEKVQIKKNGQLRVHYLTNNYVLNQISYQRWKKRETSVVSKKLECGTMN